MNDYEQFKNNWKEQPIQGPSMADFIALKSGIKGVAKKQKMTNAILLATAGVLVIFFFYIGAMHVGDVALAIGGMIAALVIRVLVEFFSISYLKNMTTTSSIQHFKERLAHYYRNRVGVNLILTPILLAGYSYAFWTLLPDFKVSLSEGFYSYVVYSSIVLLVFFVGFIGYQVHKELQVLQELKRE